MKRLRIILAQPFTLDRAIAVHAARAAFVDPEIAEAASLAEAESLPALGGSELIVLDLSAAPQACAARSAENLALPRWAVVGLGTGSFSGGESVPPEEWTLSLLARVFRQAVSQHELQRANLKLRGDLMTVARRVAHDLRSPIGCIRTNADLLKEFTLNDEEMLQGTAVVIQESVDESIRLLDRVSFILSASADVPTFETVDVGDIVAKVISSLESRTATRGAVITLPPDWPTVRGLPSWLTVIWTNLLQNCLEHAGDSPKIELTWERTASGIRFAVTDGGHGLNSARLAQIFAPFEQLHQLRTRGIGLSIVRRLLELQGGECGYLTPKSGGAVFHFTLPEASSP